MFPTLASSLEAMISGGKRRESLEFMAGLRCMKQFCTCGSILGNMMFRPRSTHEFFTLLGKHISNYAHGTAPQKNLSFFKGFLVVGSLKGGVDIR